MATQPHFLSRTFFTTASRYGDRTAIVWESSSWTYRFLMGRVQGIREGIETVASANEKLIAVLSPQHPETYASILAILAAGRGYLPIEPTHPAERNLSCLKQAGVSTLIVPPGVSFAEYESLGIKILQSDLCSSSSSTRSPTAVFESDLAYLLFTSGSTGQPKGVPIQNAQVTAFFNGFLSMPDFAFSEEDRFAQIFDLTFDLSVMSFFTPLILGASCHLVPSEGIKYLNILETLRTQKITTALLVPSVIVFLERFFDEISLPELRYSLFCGEALPEKPTRQWMNCVPNARVFNVYGPTEATVFCSSYECERSNPNWSSHHGIISIGKPFGDTRFHLLDGDELGIESSQLSPGYWKNETKTEQAFCKINHSRIYRTGDLVHLKNENFLYQGRIDNQVKIDGFRVELGELEHHARENWNQPVAAIALSTEGTTRLHLFVETANEWTAAEKKSKKEILITKLPKYLVPAEIHCLKTLPLNVNGKIDRPKLLSFAKGTKQTLRHAQASDIPLLIEGILAAEGKNSAAGALSTYEVLFDIEIDLLKQSLERILKNKEVARGHSLGIENFFILEEAGRPLALCAAWVEAQEEVPSHFLSGAALSWALGNEIWTKSKQRIQSFSKSQIPRSPQVLQMETFYTVPSERGRGRVNQLIEAVIAQFRNAQISFNSIEITLMSGNTAAKKAYERAGFKETSKKEMAESLFRDKLNCPGFIQMRRTINL